MSIILSKINIKHERSDILKISLNPCLYSACFMLQCCNTIVFFPLKCLPLEVSRETKWSIRICTLGNISISVYNKYQHIKICPADVSKTTAKTKGRLSLKPWMLAVAAESFRLSRTSLVSPRPGHAKVTKVTPQTLARGSSRILGCVWHLGQTRGR